MKSINCQREVYTFLIQGEVGVIDSIAPYF